MVIILPIAWSLIFLIRHGQGMGKARAAIDATVCFGALTVLGCEALSLAHAYRLPFLPGYWLLLCTVGSFAFKDPLRSGLRHMLRWRPGRPAWYAWAGGAIIGLCAGGALLSALLYPPMNYDSMVYHMPRVLFWIKQGAIDAFPTDVGRQLTSGPLNAYFILQVQVLDLGSDRLANCVQWCAFIGSILAVAGIAKELGLGARGRWLSALLAATTQTALLEASTTQSDLLLTLWCAITMYYIAHYWNGLESKRSERALWAVCTGIAAGLTLLTKINALTMLLPLAVLAFAVMLRRRAWRDIKGLIVPVLLCAVLVNAGLFARNYALSGDILALESSGGDVLREGRSEPREVLLLNVKAAAGSLAGWPFDTPNRLLALGVEKIGGALNFAPDHPQLADFTTALDIQSHDVRTSPVQAALSYATLAALLAYALLRKKGRTFSAACALAFVIAYALTASTKSWTMSSARYLMPVLLLTIPLAVTLWRKARVTRRAICGAAALAVLLGGRSLALNIYQPLIPPPDAAQAGRYAHSYEQLRACAIGVDPQACAAMLDGIEALGAESVGIDQPEQTGLYPFLYPLRAARYDVRYITVQDPPGPEDAAFLPDVILRTDMAADVAPEQIYHGARYRREAVIPAWVGTVQLYVREKE